MLPPVSDCSLSASLPVSVLAAQGAEAANGDITPERRCSVALLLLRCRFRSIQRDT